MPKSTEKTYRPLVVIEQETISPAEYTRMDQSQRSNIESAKIIPPRLGESGFGKLSVRYRIPILKQKHA